MCGLLWKGGRLLGFREFQPCKRRRIASDACKLEWLVNRIYEKMAFRGVWKGVACVTCIERQLGLKVCEGCDNMDTKFISDNVTFATLPY